MKERLDFAAFAAGLTGGLRTLAMETCQHFFQVSRNIVQNKESILDAPTLMKPLLRRCRVFQHPACSISSAADC
jgi:hypothetical protein